MPIAAQEGAGELKDVSLSFRCIQDMMSFILLTSISLSLLNSLIYIVNSIIIFPARRTKSLAVPFYEVSRRKQNETHTDHVTFFTDHLHTWPHSV